MLNDHLLKVLVEVLAKLHSEVRFDRAENESSKYSMLKNGSFEIDFYLHRAFLLG